MLKEKSQPKLYSLSCPAPQPIFKLSLFIILLGTIPIAPNCCQTPLI